MTRIPFSHYDCDMKLIARIERKNDGRTRILKCTYPATAKWPFWMRESVLQRNLGPRPYAEAFYVNDNGERVVTYFK